jgi:NSS family neurotransmitter:Na+ symporter
MPSPRRAQWRTPSGFVLAALGAAIGLGNIWRFSYVVGDNGGAAFLVVYLATIALVGLPLLLVELAIGRSTQREAASAFQVLGRAEPWRRAGVLGVLASFVILTYYAVVAGWALKYFIAFAAGGFRPPTGGAAAYFQTSLRRPSSPCCGRPASWASRPRSCWRGSSGASSGPTRS